MIRLPFACFDGVNLNNSCLKPISCGFCIVFFISEIVKVTGQNNAAQNKVLFLNETCIRVEQFQPSIYRLKKSIQNAASLNIVDLRSNAIHTEKVK